VYNAVLWFLEWGSTSFVKKYYTSHCCPDLLAENAECSLRDSIGTRRPQDIHPRLRRRLSFQDLDAGETARMGESCGSWSRSNGRADGSKNGPCHRHTKNTMMPGSGHVSLVNQTYKLRSYIIYLYIYNYIATNITIWPYTERARAVSWGQFPQKSATFLGKFANTNLVCANTNSICASWASCSEVEILLLFWENPILKWYFFGQISLLPSPCPTKQLQYGRSGSVRGSIPPWSIVARYSVVFEHLSSEFPTNLSQFSGFTPSSIFPKFPII